MEVKVHQTLSELFLALTPHRFVWWTVFTHHALRANILGRGGAFCFNLHFSVY